MHPTPSTRTKIPTKANPSTWSSAVLVSTWIGVVSDSIKSVMLHGAKRTGFPHRPGIWPESPRRPQLTGNLAQRAPLRAQRGDLLAKIIDGNVAYFGKTRQLVRSRVHPTRFHLRVNRPRNVRGNRHPW